MSNKTAAKRRRVLVICRYWEERFLRGVAEHARESGWILDTALRHGSRALPKDWHGDGVIATPQGDPEIVRHLRSLGVPVVLSQIPQDLPGVPTVMHDEEAVGRLAAEHFLGIGYRRFVFIAPSRSLGSARGAGFAKRIAEAGGEHRAVSLEQVARKHAEWDAPTAIFAVNDVCAIEVMNILLRAGREVPGEFAILGVDDDEILGPLAEVPLSSINVDYEGRGRRCAEILDRMMRGEKVRGGRVVTPLRGVTGRESTNTRAIPHAGAAEALRYLRENFRQPIGLADLMEALGVPLRGIQDVFKEHTGETLAGELARLRREAALEALRAPKAKLHAIAVDCGYSGAQHLSRALLRETGKTPRAWRVAFRKSGPSRPVP